ncbi:uncharacterized protein FIBRA_09322 [Fibroporia radiculosa]|uniref:Uncharacterized protein n=1 Tax=Fibroporia radiculosa TaxID=599839 RepID=J7S6A8_9APHY|nr:uncharacterized protein FIBRA_09322 [Fibroporia radiculosa]CCM07004.1 predicted protein [Fibroporia radiculosa]
MPPLASDISNNGSITLAPNLQLLTDISDNDIIQHPSNNVTRAWQSIPFDTSTPVQDVNPLEQVLPHFPGAYTNFITGPPMGVLINGNPAFGL